MLKVEIVSEKMRKNKSTTTRIREGGERREKGREGENMFYTTTTTTTTTTTKYTDQSIFDIYLSVDLLLLPL